MNTKDTNFEQLREKAIEYVKNENIRWQGIFGKSNGLSPRVKPFMDFFKIEEKDLKKEP